MHGWQVLPPWAYGAWMRHLASNGNVIVYPMGSGINSGPSQIQASFLAGVKAGLSAIPNASSLVAIGDTTGGALAFDYAAVALDAHMQAPQAALAIFPGRNPPGGRIGSADLSKIPASTRLAVIGGPGDQIPEGEAQAHALLAEASQVPKTRRQFLRAPDLGLGPAMLGTARARRSFWRPADRLIAEARADPGPASREP